MTIPIQNLYYLLCYAWGHLEEGEIVDVSGIANTELADLFARVLISGTNHVLRRGLDQGYLTHNEDLSTLRGKIDVSETIKRSLVTRARAHCHFDELSHNVLHNQILRTTLGQLARVRGIDSNHRHDLTALWRRLADVEELTLNRLTFRRVQLHRNNRFYDLLMNVCEIVQNNLLIDQTSGELRFRDFVRDERTMNAVFEKFIYAFYDREQSEYRVSSDIIKWDAESLDEHSAAMLPQMRTDVSLRSSKRTLIIDAKYYTNSVQTFYEKASVHSSNLYQIFAYVKNLEGREGVGKDIDGMLLYPLVGERLDCHYVIQGHEIVVRTIDLTQPWFDIRENLLAFIRAGCRHDQRGTMAFAVNA